MDKLVITPGDVRGLGNLLTLKGVDDLILYNSEVTSSNNKFILDFKNNNLNVSGYSSTLINNVDSTVTATLLDDNGNGIVGTSVSLYDGNTLIKRQNTANGGKATFTYRLTTDGLHKLHVEAEGVKSQEWEVEVFSVSFVDVTSNVSSVWNGSTVTFSAQAFDSQGDHIVEVPILFTLKDGSSVLRTTCVNTVNGIATLSYSGKNFTSGNITCAIKVASNTDSIDVPEVKNYLVNRAASNLEFVNFGFSSGVYDSSNNLLVGTNQQESSRIKCYEFPEKFSLRFEYNGELSGNTGLKCGFEDLQGVYHDVLNYVNNTSGTSDMILFGNSRLGYLQAGDIVEFKHNGTSLTVSVWRNYSNIITDAYSSSSTFPVVSKFVLDVSQYNGYKINNIIGKGTY